MCEEKRGAEGVDLTTLLLGGCDALHTRMDRLAADVAADGWTDAAEAAVDLLEDLGAMFAQLREALKTGDGPEAVVAVRDTLRLVEVNRAAETATAQPVRRDATLKGLDRLIAQRQSQIDHLAEDCARLIGEESVTTSTHGLAYALRTRSRELGVVVEARDIISGSL